jgi:U3 small nucleolar RNA-associated protein 22
MFTHPTEDYSLILRLDPLALPRYYQNVNADESVWLKKSKYTNMPLSSADGTIMVNFDVADMLRQDLQVRTSMNV